ncbi:MAG: hypothetical protein R2932_36065 [Caldilineaceae bacterium]
MPTATPAVAPQFRTPEDAISHYMTGIVRGDINQILQACAIDEMSTNFNFRDQAERLQAMLLPSSLAPTDYPLYSEINKAQLTAQLLNQVKSLAFGLLSEIEITGRPITNMEPAQVNQFVQVVEPSRLAPRLLIKIAQPNAEIMRSDRYLENTQRLAVIYGADENDRTDRALCL